MKKLFPVMLLLVLVLSLTVTAFAKEENLKLHNTTAKKGETVYITVELTESVMGDAMGVTYTYNEKHLKPLPSSCSWAPSGLIQDFDRKGGVGVWAAGESQDLKGGVCVLAFQVRTLARFTETDVSATVIVKNGSQDMGEFTATGKVILDCAHTYGDWQDNGVLGHYQVCSLCDGQKAQSHQWDSGKTVDDPENPGSKKRVYTCLVCDGTKSEAVDPNPLVPDPTEPTDPVVEPEQTGPATLWDPDQQTTAPDQEQPEQNVPNQNPTQTPDHSHNQEEEDTDETIPQDVLDDILQEYEDEHAGHDQVAEETTEDPHAGHDHTTTEATNRPATAIAVVATIAILIGGMVFLVKKKL